MRHLHLQYRGVARVLPSPCPPVLPPSFPLSCFDNGAATTDAHQNCFYVRRRDAHKIYALRFWQMFRLRLHSLLASVTALGGCPLAWTFVRGWQWAWHSLLPCTRCTCGHYSLFVAQLGSFALPLATLLVVSFPPLLPLLLLLLLILLLLLL